MGVRRITTNIATDSIAEVQAFYVDLLGLDVVMDLGWIVTLASDQRAPVQISLANEGGSGTPVPDLSIEVDDVDAVHARAMAAGHLIVYPLTDEPWGMRRFYLRDPAGKLLNIVAHLA